MKNCIIRSTFLLFLATLLTSCFKEDVFGFSDKCTPTAIRIKNQLDSRIILGNGTTVPDSAFVNIPSSVSLSDVTIEYITVPSLAQISPNYTSVRDFTSPVKFTITAENGSTSRTLWVKVIQGVSSLQLKYNTMNIWYEMGRFKDGSGYYNIGETGSSTPWANTNDVAAILEKAACVPSNFPNPTGHVVLQTLMNPTGGKTVGSGIAGANIFTGAFRANSAAFLDRDKQRNNVEFGIPYTDKPTSMTFEFKYKPGTQVEIWESCNNCGSAKWQGIDRTETDSLDVFVVLQRRVYNEINPSNTRYYRIAAGWFTSSTTYSDWTTITIPIFYGQPTPQFLAANPSAYRSSKLNQAYSPRFVYQYNPKQNSNDPTKWSYDTYIIKEEWAEKPSSDPVTHITVSFNSSAGGYEFRGAGTDINRNRVGSKLEIKNVVFNQ